jgi:hypothetical protein
MFNHELRIACSRFSKSRIFQYATANSEAAAQMRPMAMRNGASQASRGHEIASVGTGGIAHSGSQLPHTAPVTHGNGMFNNGQSKLIRNHAPHNAATVPGSPKQLSSPNLHAPNGQFNMQ